MHQCYELITIIQSTHFLQDDKNTRQILEITKNPTKLSTSHISNVEEIRVFNDYVVHMNGVKLGIVFG